MTRVAHIRVPTNVKWLRRRWPRQVLFTMKRDLDRVVRDLRGPKPSPWKKAR